MGNEILLLWNEEFLKLKNANCNFLYTWANNELGSLMKGKASRHNIASHDDEI